MYGLDNKATQKYGLRCLLARTSVEARVIKNAVRRDAAADFQSQAFSGVFVHDPQQLHGLSVDRALANEI